MRDMNCVFCREIMGHQDTNFARLYPEIESRFILSTSNFHIMPCIGQLYETHCLLIPKSHVSCFRELKSLYMDEIESFLLKFTTYFKKNDDLLIFEHGVNGPSDGGCGIYHAHLHLIIVPPDFDPWRIYTFNNNHYFSTLENCLLTDCIKESPYVLVGTKSKGFKIEQCNKKLPSQYLRSCIAPYLGISNWDWREYGKQDSFYKILEIFS